MKLVSRKNTGQKNTSQRVPNYFIPRNDGSTFQSMLKLATFQIDRETYDDGFFIVFLVTADDKICNSKGPPRLTGNRKVILEKNKNSVTQLRRTQAGQVDQ